MNKFQSKLFQFCSTVNPVPQQVKKFYKLASVHEILKPEEPAQQWQIKLDGKVIRTPLKHVLAVPTLTLAHLIAHEFNMQKNYLRPSTMPLLQMARTAIDSHKDEKLRAYLIQSLINFLQNDTILFREEVGKRLYNIQSAKLDPILHNFNKKYQMNMELNIGFDVKPLREDDKIKILSHINQLSYWHLITLENKAENLKSTILAIGLQDHEIDVKTALANSRLEEQFQVDLFGMVEGHHDVDENNVLVHISAAYLFNQMVDSKVIRQ